MRWLGRIILRVVITVVVWLAMLTLTVSAALLLLGALWGLGQLLVGWMS